MRGVISVELIVSLKATFVVVRPTLLGSLRRHGYRSLFIYLFFCRFPWCSVLGESLTGLRTPTSVPFVLFGPAGGTGGTVRWVKGLRRDEDPEGHAERDPTLSCALDYYDLDYCGLDYCGLDYYDLDYCDPNFRGDEEEGDLDPCSSRLCRQVSVSQHHTRCL